MLHRLGRSIVRTTSFLGKEIAEIMRQPRLILTLVLGPFLILLLFGVGYRNEARALRTLFLVEPNSQLATQIDEYAKSLGPQLVYMGAISDEQEARNALLRRQVDVVVVAPPDAYETIRANKQATFTLLHNEIDPMQADYVNYFGRVYIDEVNRRVLQDSALQGQERTNTVAEDLRQARASTVAMRKALVAGDAATARQNQRSLSGQLSALEMAAGAGLLGVGGALNNDGEGVDSVTKNLDSVRTDTDALNELPENQTSYTAEIERLDRIDQNLADLEASLRELRSISPSVLVSPFLSETRSLGPVQPTLTDYFAPSVIVLLLQHLAITFAALSIVREVQSGTIELFRASPISPGETLLSKYLSYMLFGGIMAAILSLLVVYVLRVPMLGWWGDYVLTVALLLFTSLGLGFVISLISRTDSQAVQFAMLALLSSVFFSGFIMSLETLIPAVQAVSWMLPATYAIELLKNIMLRGYISQPLLTVALGGIGVGLYLLAWLLLRSKMRTA